MHDALPQPGEIMQEPLRALLAVVECAVSVLESALAAEYPEALSDDELMPKDPDYWTAEALASQLESLHVALGLHELALQQRHTLPIARFSETPPDF